MTRHVRNAVYFMLLELLLAAVIAGCMDDRIVDIGYGRSAQTGDGGEECAPAGEPSWANPINDIMQAKCTMCHQESSSYAEIQTWVKNGELEEYCAMGSAHYLDDGDGRDACLRWIEIGVPETNCGDAP